MSMKDLVEESFNTKNVVEPEDVVADTPGFKTTENKAFDISEAKPKVKDSVATPKIGAIKTAELMEKTAEVLKLALAENEVLHERNTFLETELSRRNRFDRAVKVAQILVDRGTLLPELVYQKAAQFIAEGEDLDVLEKAASMHIESSRSSMLIIQDRDGGERRPVDAWNNNVVDYLLGSN